MALYSLRLRRTLTSLSTLHRSLSAAISATSPQSPLLQGPTSTSSRQSLTLLVQSRPFRSTASALLSARSTYNNSGMGEEIGPDTILFEGCDYNHWLITMDFPKDPKPTPEQMVQVYVETCAKGLNISVEEAKQKIYACSTTTYTGFQAVMTEEESEKFKGLPGVVFILPDSYLDPANKEYGGDKYINGTIIPRPPPVQYGRTRGRFRDQNRNPQQPRYNQQGPMPDHQGNPSFNHQGPMQGDGRNFGAPQGDGRNFGAPQGDGRNFGAPQGDGRNFGAPQRDGRNFGAPQNYSPQQNYGPPGQGERRGPMPSYQADYNQGRPGNYHPQEQRNFPQGDRRDYGPPGQGASSGYAQNYPVHGEGQRFSQGEQRNMQREQINYAPEAQTGSDQGRY